MHSGTEYYGVGLRETPILQYGSRNPEKCRRIFGELEIMKLLGSYSWQQGLLGRACNWLYGLKCCLLCTDVLNLSDFGSSTKVHVHHMVESGPVVKAAQIQKSCNVMQFSTKTEQLHGLCWVLGESVTAGKKCYLLKSPTYVFLD